MDETTTQSSFRGTQVRDDGKGPMLVAHRHRLVVVEGADRGTSCELEGTRLTVGTSSKNDLRLNDTTVSRRHCEISVRNDRYHIVDLGSTNGTAVNGTPVVEAVLSPGARIRIGDTEILFEPKKKWERVREVEADHFGELYGRSTLMQEVFALLAKVAATDLSCILHGETGTGKELAARGIHAHSARSSHPFVVVDCGAISQSLIESELFGHERGAFTGADKQRTGAFEYADGGTIFLDEIGELPIELQPKLLRALERREIKRLGAAKPIEVDVRVIAATHRDLPVMIQKGDFREDLYYRFAEVVVDLPPLRDRKDDIGLIADRVLQESIAQGGQVRSLDPSVQAELEIQLWPGNVRELRNVLRRALAMANGSVLMASDLVDMDADRPLSTDLRASIPTQAGASGDVAEALPIKEAREKWVAPMEREYLVRLVKRCNGDLDAAAKDAGVHRKSLERLLRQHGLKASDLQ